MSTAIAIPQMRQVSTGYDFVVESNDDTADDWNFPNFADALGVLATVIGQAIVNTAAVNGSLTDWHPDIAVASGVTTKWRLSYRKI